MVILLLFTFCRVQSLQASLESLITPVTGRWQGKHFTLFGMAHWMAEHEVLAAAIFVGLSLALTAIFAALERRYKQQLTARRKDNFS